MSSSHPSTGPASAALILGALGVVFGDIGTSPLYAFYECIHKHHLDINEANVLGVVSLMFWSMTLVVSAKYVALLMNADNRGEGGILALVTLLPARFREAPGGRVHFVSLLVIAGAALLFGDGVITPSISVLSAMEGLEVASPAFKPYVVPLTVGILVGLFAVQRRGTGAIGAFFGPVMLVWFAVIAGMGLWTTRLYPGVFSALSPTWAIAFFAEHGLPGMAILGSVVLVVTGGEALYADMGHFGRSPIRVAWTAITYPALTLSYLGQGALVLHQPEAASTPFFSQVPVGPALYALVGLAAMATVIASQALISAVFSLAYQAMRLGYFPRVRIRHTSSELQGQIYVPIANWALAVSCVALVAVAGSSSKLAAAYGLAVSGTMALTSIVFAYVAVFHWGWSRLRAGVVLALLLAIDLPFLGATCLKFFEGGYLPFALGAALLLLMSTFVTGRSLLGEHLREKSASTDQLRGWLARPDLRRLPGLAVVMTATGDGVPPVLAHLFRRFSALHENVFLLTAHTEATPWVDGEGRLRLEPMGGGFFRVHVHYGYLEEPVVPSAVLHAIKLAHLDVEHEEIVYVLGRESFIASNRGRMSAWRESVFAFLVRNASDPTLYFRLPPNQVVELGSRVDL
jgi:KUP system potassium uptake protein